MNSLLAILCLVVGAFVVLAVPSIATSYTADVGVITSAYTGKAMLLCIVLAALAGFYARRQEHHGVFLLKVFISALLIRLIIGSLIFAYRGQDFFGGDALTYDFLGMTQLNAWEGDKYAQTLLRTRVSGWGMGYFVAAIYGLIGRNMLAIQFVNAVMGAITAPIIFICAQEVFNNSRVSSIAAVAVAFYPSLILWSSQGLKDGPVVFFLAIAILATLKLAKKLSVKYVIVLVCALCVLLSLRFYLFYMIMAAVAGALVIGAKAFTPTAFVRQFAVLIVLGLALTYLGVTRYASVQFESFGNLERIETSRRDAATSAKSGFGEDVDVSTTAGALTNIPLGLVYLFFAPFPWQLASLRQMITLPEMIVWWASFPMLILGLWFSIRYRLRMIAPILIFSTMLSLAYSVFQGNVGTAYRQRAQLLVFYFIFAAVGYVLIIEKREERKRKEAHDKQLIRGMTVSVAQRRG
jgi:hypothetical protein